LCGEFNLFFREVHGAETGLILRALILIVAGRFGFRLTTWFLTTWFFTTWFFTTWFFTTWFFTTWFLTTRFLTTRFFATRFFATRFLTTRFLTTRPLVSVAAMRILAVLRTRMGLLGLRLALRLDAAEHAAQLVQLAFVRQLLAVGNLDEFKDAIKFVSHLLERLGNLRGVLDGLADGRGLGGTKIGGLDPRLGTGRFRALFA
jgi:hypothetical protein